tara:strand:- start:4130 stop:4285 length:156 start_codon:yes stop_codon:yes gene_type:complete
MNIPSAIDQMKFYVKKLSAKLSKLYWAISQKVWKAYQKGISFFSRGDVSNG